MKGPEGGGKAEDKGSLWVIFVWPWNENARTKQKQQTNGNRVIWLVYRTDTNARGFCLVRRTLGWKNFMPEKFLEINRYFAFTSYCESKSFRLLEAKCWFYSKEFDDFSALIKCFVQTLFLTFVPEEQIAEVRVKAHNECARARWGIYSTMDTEWTTTELLLMQHGRPSSLPTPEIM